MPLTPLQDLAAAETAYTDAAAAIATLEAQIATARAEYDSVVADVESTEEDILAASWEHAQLLDRLPGLRQRRESAHRAGLRALMRGARAGTHAFTFRGDGAGTTYTPTGAGLDWLPAFPRDAVWPPASADEVLVDWDGA